MENHKLQTKKSTFLVGIIALFLIIKLEASDLLDSDGEIASIPKSIQDEEKPTIGVADLLEEASVKESVIKLTCANNNWPMGAISGPKVSGTKESLMQFLLFVKSLSSDRNKTISVQLTPDSSIASMYTVSNHYGPYIVRSKSWYSDTSPLDPKEFATTLEKAIENPESSCEIILSQNYLVMAVIAGRYVNLYSGIEQNYYYYYDLKILK